MTDEDLRRKITDAVGTILRPLTPAQRAEGAEYLLALGYELTRGIQGNEFARDWLDAAIADLANDPPRVVIREHH